MAFYGNMAVVVLVFAELSWRLGLCAEKTQSEIGKQKRTGVSTQEETRRGRNRRSVWGTTFCERCDEPALASMGLSRTRELRIPAPPSSMPKKQRDEPALPTARRLSQKSPALSIMISAEANDDARIASESEASKFLGYPRHAYITICGSESGFSHHCMAR